jgi:hypothetical protein
MLAFNKIQVRKKTFGKKNFFQAIFETQVLRQSATDSTISTSQIFSMIKLFTITFKLFGFQQGID